MVEQLAELDVREDIRQGRDPFARIIAATEALPVGGRLRLRAPFKPAPMIHLLTRRGYTCAAQEGRGGEWSVLIERRRGGGGPLPSPPPACPGRPSGRSGAPEASPPPEAPESPPPAETPGAREVDARGLEPPEPMMRILEAVETLKPGETLLARTDRRPMFLYEQLEQRGCEGESREAEEGGVVTRIWRP
jgi:uncharacterized protein (DUF2249 family)